MLTINNTIDGAIQDIEIKGNTVQDPDNLADIKSVGELQEDGTYKMSISSCGKNLLNIDGEYETPKTSEFCCETLGKVLKLKPNTTYRFKGNMKKISGTTEPMFTGIALMLYDNSSIIPTYWYPNNGGIKVALNEGTQYTFDTRFTTNQTDIYLRVLIGRANNKNSVINLTNIQLEEGTQATSYESYQENKCDILLPCQLEKVGDVSDRLYYDDVEKAWCIEKNILNDIINGTEYYNTYVDFSNFVGVSIPNKSILKYGGFCNRLPLNNIPNQESEGIFFHTNGNIYIILSKTKATDVEETKQWIKNNNLLVKYITSTPQKIVLPLSTQIALNSFFGTTHVYMESGEVEGTIKCKISKSLGATVQSLNNKTDILSDRIEAIEGLKDSQNMKYETDKGYLVCKETKNGVIDDLKIEGKTLVNLYENKNKLFNTNYIYGDSEVLDLSLLKTNTVYTLVVLGSDRVYSTSICDSYATQYFYIRKIGKITTFTTPSSFDSFTESIRVYAYSNPSNPFIEGDEQKFKFMILEGDHTQNPPSYFEGLMSVGQDVDKIEVLSVNENLFDTDGLTYGRVNSLVIGKYYNEVYLKSNNAQSRVIGLPVRLPQNSNLKFYFKCEGYQIAHAFFDENLRLVRDSSWHPNAIAISPRGGEVYLGSYIRRDDNTVMSKSDIEYIKQNATIIASNNFESIVYTPHQSDKKQILFYNENGELEPIQELHEWDSIEKHSDNKWYYHKRSGKVVLNGSEDWTMPTNIPQSNTIAFITTVTIGRKPDILNIICDKFNTVDVYNKDEEGIRGYTSTSNVLIRISKSKLSTQDVAGFKKWLQTNNVTVIYQLAEEEVYEIAPLHLDSYANETLILCNSGAISPKMEFSIASHINELVKSQGDRISLLEEKMYKALKQVLAGDMYSLAELLYPEDFVEENPENEIMLLPFE